MNLSQFLNKFNRKRDFHRKVSFCSFIIDYNLTVCYNKMNNTI